MKGLFPQYGQISSQDYSKTWKDGHFVFDTNVLLNLYRYRESTRLELLKILTTYSARIWIPHHVAMEFQRNRRKVIGEQNRRFSETRKAVGSVIPDLEKELDKLQLRNRHSTINTESLTTKMRELVDGFLKELLELEKVQQKPTGDDVLKSQIEELFDKKVGEPPKDQDELNKLYGEAELRFKSNIPPGFMDLTKGQGGEDSYALGGLIYKRRYGDFVVWAQMLEWAKTQKIKRLVFITDDNKDDWWDKVEANGTKVVGPRAELIEEMARKAGVGTFLMYNPENFLTFAREALKVPVSDAAIEEVRDLSAHEEGNASRYPVKFDSRQESIEKSVFEWLCGRYNQVHATGGFPDFIVQQNGGMHFIEVVTSSNERVLRERVKSAFRLLQKRVINGEAAEITLVVIANSAGRSFDDVEQSISQLMAPRLNGMVSLISGTIDEAGFFVPYRTTNFG